MFLFSLLSCSGSKNALIVNADELETRENIETVDETKDFYDSKLLRKKGYENIEKPSKIKGKKGEGIKMCP